ncbi:MAG: porin family protein [Spirochaetaceae bacterium]|nr:porin family protein [Myxococcales bacterium]MCB9723048.1 porin family protein [Spirochaetaceae bacterium]
MTGCAIRSTRSVHAAPFGLVLVLGLLGLPELASADHDRGRPRYDEDRRRGYEDDDDFDADRSGLYVGGGLVGGFTTRLEDELSKIPGVRDVDVDPSVGLAARAGFRVTPHVALEAHYEWIHDFETSVAGVEIAETRVSTLTTDVKGYLTTGRIQPYLAAGMGFLSAHSEDPASGFQQTDTDFAARFGGGVDFYLTRHVGLSLDTSYVLPVGDVEDLDYVSVGAGVFFRF